MLMHSLGFASLEGINIDFMPPINEAGDLINDNVS
jgi:hypothetical protein